MPLRPFAEHVLPGFVPPSVSAVTGVMLFLYDPVHTGSRAYRTKLVAVALGLANAARFHRTAYVAAAAAEGRIPLSARAAGALSLICWSAVFVFAC